MVIVEKRREHAASGASEIVLLQLKDETNLCGGGWFALEGYDQAGNRRVFFQNKSRAVVEDMYNDIAETM